MARRHLRAVTLAASMRTMSTRNVNLGNKRNKLFLSKYPYKGTKFTIDHVCFAMTLYPKD